MLDFEQMVAGLDDVRLRSGEIIGSTPPATDGSPFGAELFVDMDPEATALLGGAACIQSCETKVDDSVWGEDRLSVRVPGATQPLEVGSLF